MSLSKWGKERREAKFERVWTIPVMLIWSVIMYLLLARIY